MIEQCNGLGTHMCMCGGDNCVCEWHGEIPCDGCPACRPNLNWSDEELGIGDDNAD